MILKFGKFKGQRFENTPKWYQAWLIKQDWFNMPNKERVVSSIKWGVYYIPTKQGRIFANMVEELVATLDTQDEAFEVCEAENMGGRLDEMHSCYEVRQIRQ